MQYGHKDTWGSWEERKCDPLNLAFPSTSLVPSPPLSLPLSLLLPPSLPPPQYPSENAYREVSHGYTSPFLF